MSKKQFLKQTFLLIWKRPVYIVILLVFLISSLFLVHIEYNPANVTELPVALLDLAQDELSQGIWDALQDDPLMKITNMHGDQDIEKHQKSLLLGEIEALYIIEADFSEKISSGTYASCLRVYYGDSQVAARMLTESVSSTVMKLCLRQRGMDILGEVYMSAGIGFDDQLVEEADAYLEGLESAAYPMKFTVVNGADSSTLPFRSIVLHSLQLLLISTALLISCTFLSHFREDGVLRRLKSMGHSPSKHLATCFFMAALGFFIVSLPMLFIGGDTSFKHHLFVILGNFFFLIWLSLFLSFMLSMLRSRQVYLLLTPILLLSLTLFAGISVYSSGAGPIWRIVILLNPFACLLSLPNQFAALLSLLVQVCALSLAMAAGSNFLKKIE